MVLESETLFWFAAGLLFITSVLLGLVGGVFSAAAVIRARGLGYSATLVSIAVLSSLLLFTAAPVVVVWRSGMADRPSPPTDLSPIVFVAALTAVITLSGVIAWSVVSALPSRHNRRPGLRPRRHQYRAWSNVVALLIAPSVIWGWVVSGPDLMNRLNLSYRILLGELGVAIVLRRLERRYRSQVEWVADSDQGYVLYLRPFLTETRSFFPVPNAQAEFTGQGLRKWVALDEFLARDVRALGSFLALGNPSESLPPGGATRIYLSDDTWTDELKRLASGARAIVLAPGRTDSLRYELEYIAHSGLQTKLFILTAPLVRGGRWMQLTTRLVDFLCGWSVVAWKDFATELNAAELKASVDDPGPGAVVSFRRDGSSVILAQNLRTPGQYVDIIATNSSAPEGERENRGRATRRLPAPRRRASSA